MRVEGYTFQNINAAENAKKALKAHFMGGRPVGSYVTTEWVEVKQDASGFYYFLGNYAPVLGNPTIFETTDKRI
jgi:hypothetical protein